MKVRNRPLIIFLAFALVFTLVASAFTFVWLHNADAARQSKNLATSNPAVTNTASFNSEGISADANPTAGNFDGGGRSYSNDALTAAGFAPGASVTTGGYTFQWVAPAAGTPDNWNNSAQTIPIVTSAGTIAFLGSSAGGVASGTGFIRYADGSMQSFTLTFSDWTLGGGHVVIDPHDTIAVQTPYRNTPTGKDNTKTYIFMTTVALLTGKTTTSVTLPRASAPGGQHVFAVAAPSAATNRTNTGISNDTAPTTGNFDGGGRSYSNEALAAAGLGSGALTTIYGYQAQWPAVAAGVHDSWNRPGTVIPINGLTTAGATLAIFGAASGGATSGTATITYTDSTTQTFTLAFSDWTLGGGSKTVLPTNQIVAQTAYRNTPTGPQQVKTYVFAMFVGLSQGKAVQSLTLPTVETGGGLAVFAVAVGAGSSPYNMTAISANVAPTTGNFDGGGRSYSNNALAFAGITSGSTVVSNGFSFQWATNASGNPDAWRAMGQTLPLVTTSPTLAFLGAAGGGTTSGVATVTYTDGTTQAINLAFSDWTLGGGGQSVLPTNQIAAQTAYRNTPTGQEHVKTYVFFTSVALTAGKTTQSITLPSVLTGGRMVIFAVSGQPAPTTSPAPPGGPSDWTTYLGSPGRSGYNGAETTLTPATAPSLQLKWTAHRAQGISAQPIVVNGTVYWGSWDGLMHATSASTGTDLWTTNIGQANVLGCIPQKVGVAGAATYGSIGSTPVIFAAGGANTLYALNATTGQVIWATMLEASTDYFTWDSPLVVNGSVYIGVSSFGDCPNATGTLFKVNATTGSIQNILTLSPSSCPGDGLWGSQTYDAATGVIYFASGNGCTTEPNSSAVEAVSSGDLSLIDRWQVPVSQISGDTDFGNTPTLFTATINGAVRQMIGVASKNGIYYALDRTNLSAGPVWEDQVATGGDCPDCGQGSISPSSWDGTSLYIAGGSTTISSASCVSSVRQVNPATGAYLWEYCIKSGPTVAAVTTAPGLVAVSSQTAVYLLNATTGATLYSYGDSSTGSYFYSAPTIADGALYAANNDGSFYAFG